jgi:hypothetical protein
MQNFKEKSIYLRTFGSFNSALHKNDWVRKSQIRKMPPLRKVLKKSNKLLLRPQIYGFAICGTYLRTSHLWYSLYLLYVYVICLYMFGLLFPYAVYYLQVLCSISVHQSFCTYFSLLYICFSSLYIITIILSILFSDVLTFIQSLHICTPCYCMCGLFACSFMFLAIKIFYI